VGGRIPLDGGSETGNTKPKEAVWRQTVWQYHYGRAGQRYTEQWLQTTLIVVGKVQYTLASGGGLLSTCVCVCAVNKGLDLGVFHLMVFLHRDYCSGGVTYNSKSYHQRGLDAWNRPEHIPTSTIQCDSSKMPKYGSYIRLYAGNWREDRHLAKVTFTSQINGILYQHRARHINITCAPWMFEQRLNMSDYRLYQRSVHRLGHSHRHIYKHHVPNMVNSSHTTSISTAINTLLFLWQVQTQLQFINITLYDGSSGWHSSLFYHMLQWRHFFKWLIFLHRDLAVRLYFYIETLQQLFLWSFRRD
jgi:hypothetical protein